MTRINIELPDELHKRLKIEAIQKNQPLKEYIVKLLKESRSEKDEAA